MNPPDSVPSKEQSAQRQATIQESLGVDLASLTLGELLGATLSSVCLGERQAYLEQSPSEVPTWRSSLRSAASLAPRPATVA